MKLGLNESQIEAVSFGKEKPADLAGDETAAAKNRRAEFKINTNDPLKEVEIEYTDNGPYVKYTDNTQK